MAIKLINFILFQAVWFATVLGAANGQAWPGFLTIGVFLIVHSVMVADPSKDILLSAVTILIGVGVEMVNVSTGLIDYQGGLISNILPPAWILILWCNVGLIINNSVAWLQNRLVLASVLGGLGGAISYGGGVALGAAEFGVPTQTALMWVGLTWAIVTPILLMIARYLNHKLQFLRAA